jgi:hypothetical protein
MTIYAAISPGDNEPLGAVVAEKFPDGWFKIAPGQYLISTAKLTTAQVSERLGIPGGSLGRVIIMHIVNYTGWHSKDMWEWLSAQTKPPANPEQQSAEVG